MGRICAAGGRDLPQTSYTANQFSKDPRMSRCAACVHGHPSDIPSARPFESGRYNNANKASIKHVDLNNPFAEGAFRWVARGTYTSGPREGQACVTKWFKTGAVFSADYFTLDIKAVDKALEIVNRYNDLHIVSKALKINVPGVWTFEENACEWGGQKHLVEPYIQNYPKFNSNSGWNDDSRAWGEVMQALVTSATMFRADFTFSATSKEASISGRSSSLTPSSCLELASTASQISEPTGLALFSAIITATATVARAGLSLRIRFSTSERSPEPP